MKKVFTRIVNCSVPVTVSIDPTSGRNKPFEITFSADGVIPFPQVILRSDYGEQLFKGDQIRSFPGNEYSALIPADLLGPGPVRVQVEGCRGSGEFRFSDAKAAFDLRITPRWQFRQKPIWDGFKAAFLVS